MGTSAKSPADFAVTRWIVVVPAAVAKTLEKLDKPVRLRVIELIDSLATGNPRDKGKGLTANQAGKWRYRVGDYRMIVDIADHIVTITLVKVAHRSKVYD